MRSGFPNGTNGIPISFKVLPMVPLVIPFVPMVLPMVPLGEPRTEPLFNDFIHVLIFWTETNFVPSFERISSISGYIHIFSLFDNMHYLQVNDRQPHEIKC